MSNTSNSNSNSNSKSRGTGCELCSKAARIFCESDQASLCWDCDQKVHAANFLVAKHSRTLLFHSNPNSHGCSKAAAGSDLPESESDDGEYYGEREDLGSSDENEDDEDDDGENQVFPWSDSGSNEPNVKRRRQNTFESEDDDVFCPSPRPIKRPSWTNSDNTVKDL